MAIYTAGNMVANRVTGTAAASGVLELYDNCNTIILSSIGNKVSGVTVGALFQFSPNNSSFGPAPSSVGYLFDLANVYGVARALAIGVASDRVGGNYLHIWSQDASNAAYVNVVQLMRNTP